MWLETHFLRIKLKYGHCMQDTTNLTMLMRLQRPTPLSPPNRKDFAENTGILF
jgi:hypothetical protein